MDYKEYYDTEKGNNVIEIVIGTDSFQKQIKNNILSYLDMMNQLQMMYYQDISIRQEKIDNGDTEEEYISEEDYERLYAMSIDDAILEHEGSEEMQNDLKPLIEEEELEQQMYDK